MDKATF